MDELFIGSAVCEVTTGGEIVLPRHFHETILSRSPDGRLFVGLHEESPCLVVYDRIFAAQQQWDFETRRSSFLGANMEAHYARVRRAFGFAEHVTLAPDGMMVLAPLMRQRGRIGSAALLVATGPRFEIWDLDMVLERAPADLVALATLHLKHQPSNEERHGPSMHSADPHHYTTRNAQSGLRLQHVPALRPRHDPVGGIAGEHMETRPNGISSHLEKY
jgi:DNA-binding transcriptional regulator/RsmH inhibitor MraZ